MSTGLQAYHPAKSVELWSSEGPWLILHETDAIYLAPEVQALLADVTDLCRELLRDVASAPFHDAAMALLTKLGVPR